MTRPVVVMKSCATCTDPFASSRGVKYCSDVCRKTAGERRSNAWRTTNRERWNASVAASGRRRRSEALAIYDSRCGCSCGCGEAQVMFLQIDHVDDNGAEERRRGIKGDTVERLIRDAGERLPQYQVLCANCNWGKRLNGGTCPGSVA